MKLSRQGRILTATILWVGVAVFLAWKGTFWGDQNFDQGYWRAIPTRSGKVIAILCALAIGGLKGRFVLSRSAERTAKFIQRRPEKDWIWMSLHPILYLLIPLMIGLGKALRHFYGKEMPVLIVAVYVGIAVALIVGVRGFFKTTERTDRAGP